MRSILFLCFAIILAGCSVLQPPVEVRINPVSILSFAESPFGHDESIASFQQNLPKGVKVQKLIRRSGYAHHRPDTIYNFVYKKSKIAVYKTQFNQEFLVAGIVKNSEIELVNGIKTGIKRADFLKTFTDLDATDKDSIVIKHPQRDRTFRFYFNKRDKLEKFTLTGGSK